ncbi:MAG: prepilin-type N-terminal cleavage/methylation domain-containing protein [Kiloniellaceae bacterium]
MIRPASPPHPSRAAGFTLLELLISITILALLSTMMVGGLNFGARVWERTENAAQDQGRVAAVQGLLRRQVAQMATQQVRGADRRPRVAFEGSSGRLAFVAPLPQYLSQGGYHVISLETRPAGNARNLVLRWEPFDRERPGLTLSEKAHEEILLTGLAGLSFKYFGHDRRGTASGWLAAWEDPAQLPELIDITVRFGPAVEEVWPALVAAVVTESVER